MHSHHDKAGAATETSAERVNRLLQELIGLTGQQASGVPVLELQIGEIFTRTLIDPDTADHNLAITALLPRCEQPHYLPRLFSPAGAAPLPEQVDFLWHADQGCYIVVRRIAVSELADERSIMDAILLTSDIARDYHAAISADQATSR